eukprot:757310-Hanusia_phi.AAC.1
MLTSDHRTAGGHWYPPLDPIIREARQGRPAPLIYACPCHDLLINSGSVAGTPGQARRNHGKLALKSESPFLLKTCHPLL